MDKQKIVFLDANIFLELILNDKKAENCAVLLNKIKDKEVIAKTSDFIIYTCMLQIQFKLKSVEKTQKFILFINQLKGLEILRPSLGDIFDATAISEKYKLDFDDSLVVSCMKSNNIQDLFSFDKDFNKVEIIKRLEP